jgi:prepilin-type processing-associated H-X9-DG protein
MRNGASNTMVVGEKAVPIASAAGGDTGDNVGVYWGFSGDTVAFEMMVASGSNYVPISVPIQDPRQGVTPTTYRAKDSNNNVVSVNYGFGAAHPGGMNAVFGDGSVRTINFGISATVMQAISNRNNTTVVDLSDL